MIVDDAVKDAVLAKLREPRKHGSTPIEFSVVNVTPENHATEVFAVRCDWGWAESTIADGCYRQDADAIVLALAGILGVEAKGVER